MHTDSVGRRQSNRSIDGHRLHFPYDAFCQGCQGCLCWTQVTLALYHVLGVLLKREQYLSVTTVGYSAVIFGWVISHPKLPTCHFSDSSGAAPDEGPLAHLCLHICVGVICLRRLQCVLTLQC